jgi:hypothetical protein
VFTQTTVVRHSELISMVTSPTNEDPHPHDGPTEPTYVASADIEPPDTGISPSRPLPVAVTMPLLVNAKGRTWAKRRTLASTTRGISVLPCGASEAQGANTAAATTAAVASRPVARRIPMPTISRTSSR